MKFFMLVCEKPESEMFSYGHLIEFYPAHTVTEVFSSRDQVIDLIVDLNGHVVRQNEAFYEPTIRAFETDGTNLVETTHNDDTYLLISEMKEEANQKAKELRKQVLDELHEEEMRNLEKQKELEKARELEAEKAMFERLKKKFESESKQ